MKVNLAYGRGWLPVDFPDGRTVVIQPSHSPGLPDERAAVRQALRQPIAAPPLREWLKPDSRLCILFNKQDRQSFRIKFPDRPEDPADDNRRESEGRLIKQQEFGP